MQLGCYIVDDENHAIKVLKKYIENTPGLFVLGWETDSLKAWDEIDSKVIKPDITFLDVDMPQLSGIELADLLKSIPTIFTTAHPEYAVFAFEKNAIDYMLKPVTYERFLKAISKVKGKLLKSEAFPFIKKEYDFFIKSEAKGKLIKLKYDDIYYIEARANYLKFFVDKKSYLTYLTMKEIDEKLPSKQFIRVHKSYIVNIEKILAIEANQILLENNYAIEIGRSFKENLQAVINPKLITSKRFH